MGIRTFFKYLFTSSSDKNSTLDIIIPSIPIVDSQIKLNNLKITTMDLTGQILPAGVSKTLSVTATDDAGATAAISDPTFTVLSGNVTLAAGSNPRSQVVTSPDGSLATVGVTAFAINADGSTDSVAITATLSVNDVTVAPKATRLILQFS